MLAFALRRILQFIPTILAISLILFLLLNVLPGDAALMAAGGQDKGMDPRYLEEMKELWGLDQPLHLRYLTYLKNLTLGDMGLSYLHREKVSALIASRRVTRLTPSRSANSRSGGRVEPGGKAPSRMASAIDAAICSSTR